MTRERLPVHGAAALGAFRLSRRRALGQAGGLLAAATFVAGGRQALS